MTRSWKNRGVFLGVLLGVLAALPALAMAQESKKIVGVLEFQNQAGLSAYEIGTVTDMVRIAAREQLPEKDFIVMTRENLVKLLPPGKDLSKCNEAECEVEVGRQIGADYIVSGEVGRFGSSLQVKMKLYDTRSGDLVAGQIAEAKGLDGLMEPIGTKAAALFTKLSGAQPAAAVAPALVVHRDGGPYPMNPYKMWGHATFWTGLGSTGTGLSFCVLLSDIAGTQGYVLMATGGALMITGAILWIVSPGDEAWANRQKVSFVPFVNEHGGGAAVVGRW